MTNKLSTGIGTLDRKLNDGLPAGSILVLSASPASQSEQFLRDMTGARQTQVVTTRRPKRAVERSMYRTSPNPENVTVREVNGANPIDETLSLVEGLPDGANLIIDPLDPLERSERSEYESFLNAVQATALDRDALVVFHCLNGHRIPEYRDMTEYVADVVFELQTEVRGEAIVNRLAVPKLRDGKPFEKPLKLELTDKVGIDTSRDIG